MAAKDESLAQIAPSFNELEFRLGDIRSIISDRAGQRFEREQGRRSGIPLTTLLKRRICQEQRLCSLRFLQFSVGSIPFLRGSPFGPCRFVSRSRRFISLHLSYDFGLVCFVPLPPCKTTNNRHNQRGRDCTYAHPTLELKLLFLCCAIGVFACR